MEPRPLACRARTDPASHPPVAPPVGDQRAGLTAIRDLVARAPGEPAHRTGAADRLPTGGRVHRGPEADRVTALLGTPAASVGPHVVLSSAATPRVLEHELVHVAQDSAEPDPTLPFALGARGTAQERQAAPGATPTAVPRAAAGVGGVVRRWEEVDAVEYVDRLQVEIGAGMARHVGEGPDPVLPPGPAAWAPGGAADLLRHVVEQMCTTGDLGAWLVWVLDPVSPWSVVDRARVMPLVPVAHESAPGDVQMFESGRGPDVYVPAVAYALADAVRAEAVRGLARMVPRYLTALRRELDAQQRCDPADDLPTVPTLLTSRPVDVLLEPVLRAHDGLSVDVAALVSAPLDERPAVVEDLRTVTWVSMGAAGLDRWVRVTDPPDATPEEVSLALYGHPANASRLTHVGMLFGFASAEGMLPDAQLLVGVTPVVAPAGTALDELLASPYAAEARLATATPPRAGATGAAVLVEAGVAGAMLADVVRLAGRFGLGRRLGGAAERLDARTAVLAAGTEAEAVAWDGHVRDQQRVLTGVATGLAATVAQLDAMVDAQVDLGGHRLPSYVRYALYETAERYVLAADRSDVPALATDLLAAADLSLRTLPATLVAGMLRVVTESLHTATGVTSARGFDAETALGLPELRVRLDDLQRRLSTVRALLVENPADAGALAATVMRDAHDLADEVQVVAVVTQLEQAWSALEAADGVSAWFAGQSGDLEALQEEATRWRAQWAQVHAHWRQGEKDAARTAAARIAQDEAFGTFLTRAQAEITDARGKALIAEIVLAVAITLVTMGVGAYVGGAVAGAMAGSRLATVAVTVSTVAAETLTATALHMLLLAPADQRTAGDWATQAGWNAVTFGVLRVVSTQLRAAGFMRSLALDRTGRFVALGIEHSANVVVLGAADLVRASFETDANGHGPTSQEMQDRLAQGVLMYLLMAAAGAAARTHLQVAQGAGTRHGSLVREWARLRYEAAGYGTRPPAVSELPVVAEQLRRYWETSRVLAEEYLADPAAARRLGWSEADLLALRDAAIAALPEQQAFAVAAAMRPVGPDHVLVPSARVPDLLRLHQQAGATVREVRRDPTSGVTTFEVTRDGTTQRITQMPGPLRAGESASVRAPDAAEAGAARLDALRGGLVVDLRNRQLTALVEARRAAHEIIRVRHLVLGSGQAGVMAYATRPPGTGRGAVPGADVTAIPEVMGIADGPDMWRIAGLRPAGQGASEWFSRGFARQPQEFAPAGRGLASVEALAAASLATAYESGMATYRARVVRVEVNPDVGVPARLRVTVRTANGTTHHVYADSVDVGIGPGPARPLPPGVLDAASRAPLEQSGRVLYGEEALTVPMPREEVLVVGSGATAAWVATDAVGRLGAVRVDWVANPRAPAPLSETVARNVQAYRAQGIVLTAEDVASFSPAIVPGNEAAFRGGPVRRVLAEVGSVRAGDPSVPTEAGRVVVELRAADGTTARRVVDRVVVARGQAPGGPGGQAPMLAGTRFRMQLDGGRLVALTSVDPPGAVRLVGAAMTTGGIEELVVPGERAQFVRLVREQAVGPEVPANSQAVPPSVHQTGVNVPRSNRVDLTTPAVPDQRPRDRDRDRRDVPR